MIVAPRSWLPALLLPAAALAASLLPDAFLLTQDGVHRGELWRLWTGHLVHRTTEHFLFDVGTALLLLPFVRRWWIWALLPPLVGVGTLVLRPELHSYAGLSGVLHGAMVVAGLSLLRGPRQASAVERLIGLGAVVAVLAKATFEAVTHTPLFTQGLDMGGVTVFEAHLVGALVGLLATQRAMFTALRRILARSHPVSGLIRIPVHTRR